jgi:membrane protein YqaA with SNARE-associated domain
MDEANRDDAPEAANNGGWVRRLLLPAAAFALAIAVTAVLFVYRDNVAELGNAGYLGSFLVSLVANGTIILPMPGIIVLFALGATFNPWLIGLTAGAGGAIGELTGYAAGFSGRRILRNNALYIRAVGWLRKWGIWVIFLFTVTPLPLDVVGIAAGALRFPIWKFLLVCWFGKVILYTGMALAGDWGWDQMVKGAIDTRAVWVCGGAALAALALLALALLVERWTWRRG